VKCLFIHDFRALKYEGDYYTVNLSYNIWKARYLNVFESIRVCNRCLDSDTSLEDKLVQSNGIGVTFNGNIPFHNSVDLIRNSKVIRKEISKEVNETDVAIIRLHSFLGLIAIDECIKQGKPYIIELVGCPWDAFWNHSLSGKIIAPYMYLRTKQEVKRAKYVVYVTKQFLQKRYPTDGFSINCSNVELNNIDKNIIENRTQRLESHIGKIIIGTTAAVDVRYKGQETVIKALSELKKMGFTNYEYQLVGEGKNDYLFKVAKEHDVLEQVVFKGSLPHSEVIKWLDTVDIYIQPSKQEGLPRALIEAMSRGCAALGTSVAGIPELLEEEYLFNPDDIKTLSEKIRDFTILERKKEGVRNFNTAIEYDIEALNFRRKKFFEKFYKEAQQQF
jgi:glycosyltransferase involved in cell wall biosynthesis